MTCQNVSCGEESKTQVLMRVIRCWPRSRQQIAGIAQKRKQALAPCWACLLRITVDNKKKENARQMLHWFSKIIKLPVIVFSILIFLQRPVSFCSEAGGKQEKNQTVTSLLYSSPPV